MLHGTDLKPYVIFVYPPNIEKLRQIQMRLGVENIKVREKLHRINRNQAITLYVLKLTCSASTVYNYSVMT